MVMQYLAPFLAALLVSVPLAAAETVSADRYVIVQPGYPGSTAEAESFVTDLAAAIAKGGGPQGLKGAYYNETKEALEAIRAKKPFFGIVSLGFYLQHRQDLALAPILESLPPDRFYLAAKKGAPVNLNGLAGQVVEGTAFSEKEFVERLLFGPGAGGGPVSTGAAEKGADAPVPGKPVADVAAWKAQSTSGFSKGVRDVSKGKAAAVLLTERELRAMKETTAGKELDAFYRTEALPTAIVVSFGPPTENGRKAVEALKGIKDNPDGKELVKLMGIDGFGPVDPKAMEKFEKRFEAAGPAGGPEKSVGKQGER
jgi:hypothetical protein